MRHAVFVVFVVFFGDNLIARAWVKFDGIGRLARNSIHAYLRKLYKALEDTWRCADWECARPKLLGEQEGLATLRIVNSLR